MTSFILLLAVCSQAPNATVTLSETAPLRRLMPKLAETCHRPLHVRPSMENDVLCLSVHDVPVDALLAKVAAASGAIWVQQGDEAWLQADPNARAALNQRGLTARATRIQADIDRLIAEPKPAPKQDADEAIFANAQAKVKRLTYQIASSVGCRAIAALPECGRLVYSTRPTPRQRQLQLGLSDITGVLEATYQDEIAAMKSYVQAHRTGGAEKLNVNSFLPPAPRVQDAVKVDVVVMRAGATVVGDLGAVTMGIVGYDANGAAIRMSLAGSTSEFPLDSGAFDPGYSGLSEEELSKTSVTPAPKTKFSGSLPLQPTTVTFCNYVTGAGELHGGVPDADVRQRLLNPEKTDPLTYPAELLKLAAQSRQLQLVAALPDSFFGWADNDFFSGKDRAQISAGYVFDKLAKDTTLATDQSNGWLTVSPTDFSRPQVDRRLLQSLSAKYNEKHDFAWDDMAELSRAGYGVDDYSNVIDTWMTLVCPALWGLQSDWQVVRFFAATDAAKLPPLLNGGSAQLHDLGLDATPVADTLIFQPAEYQFGQALLVRNGRTSAGILSPIPGVRVSDYRSEPTEIAASGLTGNESVTVMTSTETIMRPGGQKSYSHAQQFEMTGMNVEELADEAVDKHYDPNDSSKLVSVEYDKELALYKSVQIGVRTTITLRIYAGPESYREYTLDFPSFPSNQLYTLKTLPGNLQAKFDEAVAAAKQQAKDELGGDGGGTPP